MELRLKLTGISSLVTHNERLANPLDPGTRRLADLIHKKGKTEADLLAIARLEWELGQYRDDQGPVLPLANVRKCLVEAARASKSGKQVAVAVTLKQGSVPLLYKGPRGLDEMWAAREFMDQRTVGQRGQRILRTRPRFDSWCAEVMFYVNPSVANVTQVVAAATLAGDQVGLCEWRPSKGGFWGRFTVEQMV